MLPTIGVQPLDGVSVLIVEFRGNPDDDVGVDAGSVRDWLPEVIVIRTRELVLDDNLSTVVDNFGKNVDIVFPYWFLSFNEFDIETNRIL